MSHAVDVRRAAIAARRLGLLFVLGALSVSGCEMGGSREGPVHPRESALVSAQVTQTVLEHPRDNLGAGVTTLWRLDSTAVGEFDGPSELVFGNLTHAVVLRPPNETDQAVALLDVATAQLRLFTANGSPLTASAGFGDGPGEITAPASLGLAERPDVAIVGDYAGKVHRFRMIEDSLVYESRLMIDRPFESVCATGGVTFVLAPGTPDDGEETPPLIYPFPEDAGAGAFGRVYDFPDPRVRYWYGQGHLACSAASVFYGSVRLGEVHAFSPAGELRWIRPLPDFQTVPSYLQGNTFAYDQGTRGVLDMLQSITAVGDSLVVVQVARTDYSRRPPDPPSLRTYVLRSSDGSVAGTSESETQVLGGSDSVVILYSATPYPRFEVKSLREAVNSGSH